MGVILRCGALLALLLLTCCAGNPSAGSASVTGSPAPQPAADTAALSALAQAPAPPGVDSAVWRRLKDALARVLESRPVAQASLLADSAGKHAGLPHQVSAPPVDEASRTTLSYNEAGKVLSWGYFNSGDYDQNGEVGVSDLTPLGQHFGETSPAGPPNPFPLSTVLAIIDGNGDGEINIADITPIGMHFGTRIQGYHVYRAAEESAYPLADDAPNGIGTELIGQLPLADYPTAGQRRSMYFPIEPQEQEHYYWVRCYDGFADGSASNSLKIAKAPNKPPQAELLAVSDGVVPYHVRFDGSYSSDPDGSITQFEWDWDNDDVYDYSTGTVPRADFYYYSAGSYTIKLRVTDDAGASDVVLEYFTVFPGATWHREIAADAAYESDTRVGSWLNGYWMLDVGGKPAFIYVMTENPTDGMPVYDKLYFTRAIDSDGTHWNEPLELDSVKYMEEWGTTPRECLRYPEGFFFADKPSVTYWHGAFESSGNFDYDTRLAVAKDTAGAAWSPQQQMFEHSRSYYGTAIIDCQGLPIYVADGIVTGADDPSGSSWTTRYAFPMLGGSNFVGLGMVQNSPAIAVRYPTAEVGNLLYMRATDLEGRQWPKWPTVVVPVNAASASTSTYVPRIFVADGMPAIAYFDDNLSMLKYVRALDETGSAWGEPVALDLWTDGWQSVALLEGRPAILYEDGISGEMKLVVANDKAGVSWSFPVFVDLSQGQAASAGHAASRSASALAGWSQDILKNIGGRLAFSLDGAYTEGTQHHQTAELAIYY